MLFRNHTHVIDLIQFLAESPPEVIAELEPGFEDYGTAYRGDGGNEPATEPAANYYVAFENGVRAYVTGMKDTVAADVLLHLIGPEGRLNIDLEGMRIMSVANEDVRTKAGVATISRHATLDGGGFQAAWLDLIDALETGREVESPAESARRTVALTQAILLPAARQRPRPSGRARCSRRVAAPPQPA